MRQLLDTLIVGTVVAVMALPAGTPAGGSGNQREETGRSLRIGLGVRVDSDWISLCGTWSVSPSAREVGSSGVARELTIGSVPNMAGRVRKGAALIRALRTTTLCVAKHLLTDQLEINRPEGK